MALVNKIIPGFFNGVSQRAPALRQESQCESLENGLTTMEYGLNMRPHTDWETNLIDSFQQNIFSHVINRDINEKYLVFIDSDTNNPIKIFTLDGTPCTVRYGTLDKDYVFTADDTVKAYLTASDPRTAFRATTIADYTIIANRFIMPQMAPDTTSLPTPKAFIYVVSGGPGVNYNFNIDGVAFSIASGTSSDPTTYSTEAMVTKIYNAINAQFGGGQAVTVFKNTHGSATQPLVIGRSCIVNWTMTSESKIGNHFWITDSLGNTVVDTRSPNSGAIYLTAGNYTMNIKPGTKGFLNDQSQWAQGLVTVPSNIDWILTRIGNTIAIEKQNYGDFPFSCSDGQGDSMMRGIKGIVQKFTDLPPAALEDTIIEVIGDKANSYANYYVRYNNVANRQNGVWTETLQSGIKFKFDDSTMPHRLVRTGTNEFTFAPIIWAERLVGNEVTAPNPSFINNYINGIVFHKNRLGFLTGENTVFSRAGDFFNFFPSTGQEVVDDDPIDESVSSTQINLVYNAISFNKGLLLFSEQEQFVSTSGDQLFTPKTAAFMSTTKYHVNVDCLPVGVGSSVYFAVPSGTYTQIRQYFVQPDSLVDDAIDITSDVPEYLPGNMKTLAVAPSKNILFCLSSEDIRTLYVYKWALDGGKQIQSSWSKWTFDSDIANIMVIDNYLYILAGDAGVTVLLRMDLERVKTGSLNFRVHLDKQVNLLGTYDSVQDKTTWTLPYNTDNPTVTVVKGNDGLPVPNTAKVAPNEVEAPGDWTAFSCLLGVPYALRYRFSEWYIRNPNTNLPDTLNRLQIRTITVTFSNTSYFRLEVTPLRRETALIPRYTYGTMDPKDFTGFIIGVSQLGTPNLITDKETFLVMTNARGSIIELVNDSYLPCEFQTATFEGLYTQRGRTL